MCVKCAAMSWNDACCARTSQPPHTTMPHPCCSGQRGRCHQCDEQFWPAVGAGSRMGRSPRLGRGEAPACRAAATHRQREKRWAVGLPLRPPTRIKLPARASQHRYYGKSQPLNGSTKSAADFQYLTVEQAVVDYVKLIEACVRDTCICRRHGLATPFRLDLNAGRPVFSVPEAQHAG